MHSCPKCGVESISQWQRLYHLWDRNRFLCSNCKSWLYIQNITSPSTWHKKLFFQMPGMLITPPLIVIALFTFHLLFYLTMTFLNESDIKVIFIIFISFLIISSIIDARAKFKSSQIVVADQQIKPNVFTDFVGDIRKLLLNSEYRNGMLKLMIFMIQLFFYLWLSLKIINFLNA